MTPNLPGKTSPTDLHPVFDRPLKPGRDPVEFTPELRIALLEKLEAGLEGLGLRATERQKQKLIDALAFLSQWNAVINLTAIRDPEAMLVQHVLDSLAVVPFIPEEATSLLDVGSGGGFPALPIAVMLPELEVVAIDAVRKKTDYITKAAEALGMKNLSAVHGRVEAHPVTYDVVISRAYASLVDFVKTAHACLSFEDDALMLAMKGKRPVDEIAALESIGWRVSREQALTVPFLEAERCLLWLEPAR
ncbi:MAG: 16S rRNA (guanine(527)-N(7))-methyltransferase RsmG [Casimicrobiaceae bacterium]